MNEHYDFIILGTGLKECILSGLLSADGKKILQMDKNDYYGGDCASLNLKQLYRNYKEDQTPKESLGDYRSFIIDLCPKFLMFDGLLVKMLILTKVTRYLDFKVIHGSYVYKDGTLYKMPATPADALSSNLMGFMQKRKLKNFLVFVQNFDENNSSTQTDLKQTMRKTFEHFGLDQNTIRSVGHALALQLNDDYLDDPDSRLRIIKAIKLYSFSLSKYGKSPFVYPVFSLSGLPEGFARLSAVKGGTFMLEKPIDAILYDEEGMVRGVKSNEEEVYCKQLIASPCYFAPDCYVRKGRVARLLSLARKPLKYTKGESSAQVIIPGELVGHKSDIYGAMLSSNHKVVPKGMYAIFFSTLIETDDPEKELDAAKKLLEEVEEQFFFVADYVEPTEEFNNKCDGTFMTSSYDATTHFMTVSEDVLHLYEKITGKKIDFSKLGEEDKI